MENKLSKKERRVDALALRAEERRDKLRKAVVRSKYSMTHGYLNGETRLEELQSSIRQSITYGREPGELKHLSSRRKRKKHRFPVRTATCIFKDSRKVLGKPAGEGESPVHEVREELAGSRVHRDTRNLDGMSGDHSVRLNTT